MYYIIRKVHVVDNEIVYTPIGYTQTLADQQYIHEYDTVDLANAWIATNISGLKAGVIPSTQFFIDNDITHLYIGGWQTRDITDMNLSLISDLDNPEGV